MSLALVMLIAEVWLLRWRPHLSVLTLINWHQLTVSHDLFALNRPNNVNSVQWATHQIASWQLPTEDTEYEIWAIWGHQGCYKQCWIYKHSRHSFQRHKQSTEEVLWKWEKQRKNRKEERTVVLQCLGVHSNIKLLYSKRNSSRSSSSPAVNKNPHKTNETRTSHSICFLEVGSFACLTRKYRHFQRIL